MPSLDKDENRKNRQQQKAWRDKVIARLGFKDMAALARAAGVNDGDLSGISRGTRKPSNAVAHKLILAIRDCNYQKGWNYAEAALYFQDTFNYLRGYYAQQRGEKAVFIDEEDILKWYDSYLYCTSQQQEDFAEPLSIIAASTSVGESLSYLLESLKNWKMKHDFDLLGKKKYRFQHNKAFIIKPTLYRAMKEEQYYEQIKAIYTEIRHIAYLCGAFELVQSMSYWLRDQAKQRHDIQTEVKTKVTIAWMQTSFNSTQSLQDAKQLVQAVNGIVSASSFLAEVSAEDMDVIATLAELRMRLEIRLAQKCYLPLSLERFNKLSEESEVLLCSPASFHALPTRLQSRYTIPLDYQYGVYLHSLRDYEGAQLKFESIVARANRIGWIRIEQAAYSWLAESFEKMGDRENCCAMLEKMTVPYLPKRQLIRANIRANIAEV